MLACSARRGQFYLNLTEGQRQAVIMALAHLAVERPGWDGALAEIADPIDRPSEARHLELFETFKRLHVAELEARGRARTAARNEPSIQDRARAESYAAPAIDIREAPAR